MADYIDWPGQSGQTYRYWFMQRTANGIKAEGGNYMFLRQLPNGRYLPVYIGQADNLQQRVPNHDRWDEAVKAGATHVVGHTTPGGERARLAEERDLIQHWGPVLNTQHKKAS